ncbi:beta-ketoacyl synthase N-terminal-like domain-containing protein [Micromonospora sp. WMMA1947]|uniref:beta-ketoacyl synthase N-terminal-like domain-containing protein n=1 Tax=Micromonospora sp. WMMA1947 TaxID=3015163 RepID=UPI00248D1472|nr:beta-ketoacyl synthase N-terminal-like domain-containing protein [Micromonospora sp. WMMA1947]WBC07494.1 beta-ketoacyl synthase N-terminal-like domain-containing protein [Micromonospora sp. WMMA1947]
MSRQAGVDDRLVLTDWAALSPWGVGAESLATGIRSGGTAVAELDPTGWQTPYRQGALITDLDLPGLLGNKGIRSMDRATGIAVATVGLLLAKHPIDRLAETRSDVGLVLGTTSGSVQSMMRFTRDSLTGAKPYHVDPARFPNTVMNRAAGQCAIWHGLKGPNTTVAGGAVTGLLALSYAMRLQRGGHCAVVVCGAVEEFSEQRAWLEWHARGEGVDPAPLGEGAVVFLTEWESSATARGREPVADLLATEFGAFTDPESARFALGRCVNRALRRAGVHAEDVELVVPAAPAGPLGEAEQWALDDAFSGNRVVRLRHRELLGDAASVSANVQIAVALVADVPGPAAGRLALVTSVDREGIAGCLLMRLRDNRQRVGQPPADAGAPTGGRETQR